MRPPPPPPPPPLAASQKGKGLGKGRADPLPIQSHDEDGDEEGQRPKRHAEDEGAENPWTNQLFVRLTGFEPTHSCCGSLSLLLGVEIICLSHLLVNLVLIANTSAAETKSLAGLRLTPYVQVWNGMWALFGIPIIIGAGIGALYRIESHLRLYMWYLIWSLISSVFWTVFWMGAGRACDEIAHDDLRASGEGIVCGSSVAIVLFGMLWAWFIQAYCLFIVWSAAEECRKSTYIEVEEFIRVLQNSLTQKAGELDSAPKPVQLDAPNYGSIGPVSRFLPGAQSRSQMAYNPNAMSNSAPPMGNGFGKGIGKGW